MAGGKLKKLFGGKNKSPTQNQPSTHPPSYTSYASAPSYTSSPSSPNYNSGFNTFDPNEKAQQFFSSMNPIPEHPSAAPPAVPIFPLAGPNPAPTSTPLLNRPIFQSRSRPAPGPGSGPGSGPGTSNTSIPSANGSSASATNLARDRTTSAAEIRRCTKLLRHMFELRMEAWTMQGAFAPDEHRRIEREQRADMIMVNIREMVDGWTKLGPGAASGWSEEEFQEVIWIAQTLGDPSWRFGRGVVGVNVNGNGVSGKVNGGGEKEVPAWAMADGDDEDGWDRHDF